MIDRKGESRDGVEDVEKNEQKTEIMTERVTWTWKVSDGDATERNVTIRIYIDSKEAV